MKIYFPFQKELFVISCYDSTVIHFRIKERRMFYESRKIADLKIGCTKKRLTSLILVILVISLTFSGYESEPHERVLVLFIARRPIIFIYTALEVEDAEKSSWTYPVYGYLDSENPWEKIAALLNKRTQARHASLLEKQALSLARFDQLKTYFPPSDFSHDVTPFN